MVPSFPNKVVKYIKFWGEKATCHAHGQFFEQILMCGQNKEVRTNIQSPAELLQVTAPTSEAKDYYLLPKVQWPNSKLFSSPWPNNPNYVAISGTKIFEICCKLRCNHHRADEQSSCLCGCRLTHVLHVLKKDNKHMCPFNYPTLMAQLLWPTNTKKGQPNDL